MAEVSGRVVVSDNDCLDIEIFSNIDNYISYIGYPDQDTIDQRVVLDETGDVYDCSIVNEWLQCSPSPATPEEIARVEERIRAYIKTQSADSSVEGLDFNQLIEEIVKLRGVTY